MTLKQILSQLEQLQLALDEHITDWSADVDSVANVCILLEDARSILHNKVQDQERAHQEKLEEELEAIADRLEEKELAERLEDEEDGREVYEDFCERAFTRGLG